MAESSTQTESTATAHRQAAAPGHVAEDRDYQGVLKSLVGKRVRIANPQSYEAAPVGFQLREAFYDAKIVGCGRDYVILITDFVQSKKDGGEQRVKQYLPASRIKRVSVLKNLPILHL